MKYVTEFRDGALAGNIANNIRHEADTGRSYHLMEFCGGHTHAIFRYGIPDLLPASVQMVHGPGCPVCVLPIGRIDSAMELAQRHGVILCSYGDTLRVPGSSKNSLLTVRAQGADVRMVYSISDALKIAEDNPGRQVVFFAIGFETSTPPTAVAIQQAAQRGLHNFSIFCNHVLTPAAINSILAAPDDAEFGAPRLDGFVGPAHVSTIIGSRPYEHFAEQYRRPVVIAGFEPLDVLQAILMLVRQLNEGRAEVENEYRRAVTRDGNFKAQQLVADCFDIREQFEWRGLGMVPNSGLRIKARFAEFDAEHRFSLQPRAVKENRACLCPAILRGVKKPRDCSLFGNGCTPENPVGSCMVSSEGACAAHYSYGRYQDQ